MWVEIINGAITQTLADAAAVTTHDGTQYPGTWPKASIPNLAAVTLAAPAPAGETVTGSTVALVNGVPVQTITTAAIPPAEAAQAALATLLAKGLTITSTGTPAVNGTYAVNQTVLDNISGIEVAVLANGSFLTGATQPFVLQNGSEVIIPSVAVFKEIATAIGVFYDEAVLAAQAQAAGGTATWPSSSVIIA
ncbi:MAG: hypothetical protein P4N59_11510 [Negativicutes bacterium]|nr:hypothetical protein [Negativicutes bacterium]